MPTEKSIQASRSRAIFIDVIEMVSKTVFKSHYDLITESIGDSPGIYALYDNNDLYYVGKSIDLKKRVRQHLTDRHLASWTHFSLYLARKEKHIADIESLLVRIANPKGNRVVPKGNATGKLRKKLEELLKQKHKQELKDLFGTSKYRSTSKSSRRTTSTLKGIVKQKTAIFRTFKGKEHKAFLMPNGKILMNNKQYTSATSAAKSITKFSVNGLDFWYIKDDQGEWLKVKSLVEKKHA